MGKCDIDHTHADVGKKFDSQKEFLSETLVEKVEDFLTQQLSQIELNELFHLLKKYDLATDDERIDRDEKLTMLVR